MIYENPICNICGYVSTAVIQLTNLEEVDMQPIFDNRHKCLK